MKEIGHCTFGQLLIHLTVKKYSRLGGNVPHTFCLFINVFFSEFLILSVCLSFFCVNFRSQRLFFPFAPLSFFSLSFTFHVYFYCSFFSSYSLCLSSLCLQISRFACLIFSLFSVDVFLYLQFLSLLLFAMRCPNVMN